MALLIPNTKCPDHPNSNVIDDVKSGRKICEECGLVLQNQIISDKPAWTDHVGQPQPDVARNTADLSTTIEHKNNSNNLSKLQKKIGANPSQSKFIKGINNISKYCSRLSLPKDVQNFAGELFKELLGKKEMQGKKAIVMITACVYIAAKHCHCDRPLKELCQEFEVDRTSVRKIHTEIHKLKSADKLTLPQNKGKGMIRQTTAEIYAQRYANQLKLNVDTIKNLKKIARKIIEKDLLLGKQPATVAAVAVYLTCVVSVDELERRSYKEISAVSRVSEHTISNVFKKHVFLFRKQIIPDGYGDPLRINNLTAKIVPAKR
eukprot:81734_1